MSTYNNFVMARLMMMDRINDFDFDVNDGDTVVFKRDESNNSNKNDVAIYDCRGYQVGWLSDRESPLMSYVLYKTSSDLMIVMNVHGDVLFETKMGIKVQFYNVATVSDRRHEVANIIWQAFC